LAISSLACTPPGIKIIVQAVENLAASELASLTDDEHTSIQALLEEMLHEVEALYDHTVLGLATFSGPAESAGGNHGERTYV